MTWSRLLLLALVVSLALPVGLLESAPRRRPEPRSSLSLAAPGGSAANPADADGWLANTGDKRRKNADRDTGKAQNTQGSESRKRDARAERDRKTPPRKRGANRDEAQARVEPTRRELADLAEQQCDGPGMIYLPRSGLCTHGPDPVSPGVDVTDPVLPLPRAAARNAAAALTCDGDGRSGPRVQVLYARASNVTSRHAAFLPSFRAWAADVDSVVQESAAMAGGARRVRFVTTPGCQIDVPEAVLSPAGDDSFDNIAAELKAQGYNRSDRKYLVFLDVPATFACGQGSRWDDDGPGQANRNNYGPSFATVYNDCWDGGHTPQHELMHTLGGVQDSAPNSSRGGHCIDEYDVMCYSDEPFFPTMRHDCLDEALEDWFDCNHDDYFHPNPPADSYLDTHWNAANSRFLIGGGNGGDDDGTPPVVTWVSPVANDGVHEVAAGTLTLEVEASDGSGINRVRFWRYDATTETSVELALDREAPYTTTLSVSTLSPGYNSVWAIATDGVGTFTVASIGIRRTEPNATPPSVTWTSPVGNGETHRASRGILSLAVEASDPSGIAEVEFDRYDEITKQWIEFAVDESPPYAASLALNDLLLGYNYVIAEAVDTFGNRTAEHIWIERTEPPPPVAITSPQDGARVKPGAALTIAVAVAEPAGAAVEVRSCPGGSCSWAAGTPLGSDDSAPFAVGWTAPAAGSVTFLAQLTAGDGPKLSDPVTVSVGEAKAKKKKKKGKKKKR